METFNEFLNRINSFEKLDFSLEKTCFKPDFSLTDKVDENNQFKDFYGDTVVFDLDQNTKNRVANIINKLYNETSTCFCEKRVIDTLHMTLHDLTNSNEISKISNKMNENLIKLKKLITHNPIESEKIKMKTNFITDFGHVNLVLALCPKDEREYNKLMKIYSVIDNINLLDYKFKPHITLAYFNSNGFDVESVDNLEKIVRKLNKEEQFDIILDTEKLYYQRFDNMNSYKNIFKLV